MTPTNTEALRLADAIECSEPFTLIDKACNEAAAELRRLAAVEAERDKFASESAQHFIRGREWAERAGQMEAERDVLLKEKHTLTHQVICCGVAATHPDPLLTTRGAYAGRWNSNQAESVRHLRAERDALRADAERYRWLRNNPQWLGWEHDFRPDEVDREIDAAIDAAMKGTT